MKRIHVITLISLHLMNQDLSLIAHDVSNLVPLPEHSTQHRHIRDASM
jgi:hypothetical protein